MRPRRLSDVVVRPLNFSVRATMRLTHVFAPVLLAAIAVAGYTSTAPAQTVQTRIAEGLPPTVCDLRKHADMFDGHQIPVMGTLHLGGETVTLGDPRCPSVRVVLTKRAGVLVNFTSIGDDVLVRLVGTYHRAPVGELDVTSIEPEAAFEKRGQ